MRLPGYLHGDRRLARELIIGQALAEQSRTQTPDRAPQAGEEAQPAADQPLMASESAVGSGDAA